MKIWKATAPANIALIKYMGKMEGNRAVNPSLSMTLSAFQTSVEIALVSEGDRDTWRPLPDSSPLREESTKKFMNFFTSLKTRAEVQGSFEVRSGNNFPSDAGLASSASSFAALTKAATLAFCELKNTPMPNAETMALISRAGSGSSCRSFFSPWCAWEGDSIHAVESKLPPLVDMVVVVESGYKKVSSSEAHLKIKSSPLFLGRPERAAIRMEAAKKALLSADYKTLAEISWAELWDMHSLFHTANPPFFYFSPETISVLRWVENMWEKNGTGPIATIDAGPNVHLLVPEAERGEYRKAISNFRNVKIMESMA